MASMLQRPDTSKGDEPKGISAFQPAISSTDQSASPNSSNTITSANGAQNPAPVLKKSPIWSRAWKKIALDRMAIMFMIKGALPPTICMSMYQSHGVAANYLNLGYLMIIISILTVPMLPRGKFLMNLFISLVRNYSNSPAQGL